MKETFRLSDSGLWNLVLSCREVLSNEVLYEQGSYKRTRERWRGWYFGIGGILAFGDSQYKLETIVERDIITPIAKFEVRKGG